MSPRGGGPGGDRLDRYRGKRRAGTTPEPFGGASIEESGAPRPRLFVVQMHAARNLHWDLRLEMDGALESWAVPKGPSPNPADKRLAMHVEPHPLEYADFEGVIPEGQYGAGPSICWDRGVWIEVPARPGEKPHGLEHGKLLFELRGHKLRGLWTLVHTPKGGENHWLLIKERDSAVDEGGTEIYGHDSIFSGLTVEELRDPGAKAARIEADAVEAGAKPWSGRAGSAGDEGAIRGRGLKVMKAVARDDAFDRKGWLWEIKYDGYRLLAERHGGGATLWSRNGNDLTETFPEIARAVRGLPFPGMVLDGEVVVHDGRGMPAFSLLQKRGRLQRRADIARASVELPASYYTFDLLAFGGLDLRGLPLTERKRLLRDVLPSTGPLRYSDHVEAHGKAVFRHAEELGIEGVVGKKAASTYVGGRSESWVKVRTVHTDDFVVVGWTEPKGSRQGLGALHLAQWLMEPPLGAPRPPGGKIPEGRGDSMPAPASLRYFGSVGTGFTEATLAELSERLAPLRTDACPCACGEIPSGRTHHWVQPEVVVEVRFKEVTPAGMLRHPSFLRLRDDKEPEECVPGAGTGRVVQVGHTDHAGEAGETATRGATHEGDPGDGDAESLLPEPPPVTGAAEKHVALTNLEKTLFPPCAEPMGLAPPHDGLSKGEVIAWYEAAAPWMLPYLRGRCLVLTRYPDGIDGNSFYQKNAPDWAPDWIRTETVYSEGSERDLSYFVVDDVESLRYVANSAALLMHVWSSRVETLAHPDWCVLDLDPKGAPFTDVVAIARLLKALGDEAGFPTYVKTSGSSGLHVLVPLGGQLTHDQAKQLGQLLATVVVQERPDIATVDRVVERRGGKVYVDYLQNGWGKLLVAPYSTRPVPEGAVSMPLEWDEVTDALGPRDFTMVNAVRRLERWDGDPMASVLTDRVDLLAALNGLMGRIDGG